MEKNEIKKLLYKQNPLATRVNYNEESYDYIAYVKDLEDKDTLIKFKVPTSDMGDGKFTPEMEAKYLIRWIL